MAAPDLTQRCTVFVNKVGTDDAGANAVGAPQPRLTIAAALTDLLANYPTPSASNPCTISIGPGTFTTPAFAIPPWVWIVGTADGEGKPITFVNLSGNITLATGWNAGATKGGLTNLTVRAASGLPHIDLTMPAVAGNPSRIVQLENIKTDLELLNFQGVGTGDSIEIDNVRQDGNLTHNITLQAGIQKLNNLVAAATTTLSSTAGVAATVTGTACSFAALVLTKNAGALTVTLDAISVPILANLTLNGGAVFVRGNDANGEGYTPAIPGNWSPVPTTVQQALDELAASAGPLKATDYATYNNNAGPTTIITTADIYFFEMTVGGAARTSIIILNTVGPPAPQPGSRITVGCTLPATPAIVLEFHNNAAGGTLLYTFTTDGVTLSALFEFVYSGTAWRPSGYLIPYQV